MSEPHEDEREQPDDEQPDEPDDPDDESELVTELDVHRFAGGDVTLEH